MGAYSSDASIGWWSLYLNPEGTVISFSAQAGGRQADYLRAPIEWQAGVWHEVLLCYNAQESALFLDGDLATTGSGVWLWPPDNVHTAVGFTIGGTGAGDGLAQGEFDELTTYTRVPDLAQLAWIYRIRAPVAARGPIISVEDASRRRSGGQMMTLDSPSPPDPGGGGGGGGSTNSICNSLTNFTVGYFSSTNGLSLGIAQTTNPWIALTIQTATTNLSYDMFGSTSLAELALPSLSRTNWTWLTRARAGPTNFSWGETNWCARYFQLGTMQDSDNDGLTDAYETLVSKTQTNVASSPRAIYEDVISHQSPSNWFKLNDGSLTNAISGQTVTTLTSTGTWDVDAFATGSNAINFNGTSQRFTSGDVISGGTGTNQGSMSLLFRSLTGYPTTLLSTQRYVFCQKGNASNEFGLFFETNNAAVDPGSLKVHIGGQTNMLLASNAIVFGTWYYLAMTWKESNHLMRWYLAPIGGVLMSSNITLAATNVVGNSTNVSFGNRPNDAGSYVNAFRTPGNGALDQIAFWNRELTGSEVNAQFNTLNEMFQGPSKVFNLTRFNILLPINNDGQLTGTNPLEIRTGWLNSGFRYLDPTSWTQRCFYLTSTNTMVFEAPWNGAKTPTSSGPRSELRGTLADGNEDNWTPLGTNTLEATFAVNEAGTNGTSKLIIGQIYCDSTSTPTFAVNYNHPNLKDVSVTFKSTPSGGTDGNLILATNVNLLAPIHYKVQLLDDGTTVKIRGEVFGPNTEGQKEATLTSNPSNAWHSATFYFKAGCYYPNGPTSGTAKVTFSSLSATQE